MSSQASASSSPRKPARTQQLTIGQVAKNAGVGVETVRFYERQGLICRPERPDSGYRRYSHDVVQRIRFIRRAKELGFSLAEIRELLELRADPAGTCADVRIRAQAKIGDIEGRIQALGRMRTVLEKVVAECAGEGPLSECPILDMLDVEVESSRAGPGSGLRERV
jgi:MerR family transcriptional regulator, copper efflux regulator